MKPLSMPDTDIDGVYRGGSWYGSVQIARVAARNWWPTSFRGSYLGFRLNLEVR